MLYIINIIISECQNIIFILKGIKMSENNEKDNLLESLKQLRYYLDFKNKSFCNKFLDNITKDN